MDALLLGIYSGMQALCRRFGADWNGPNIDPLNDQWLGDLADIALMTAEEDEELQHELARMRRREE